MAAAAAAETEGPLYFFTVKWRSGDWRSNVPGKSTLALQSCS